MTDSACSIYRASELDIFSLAGTKKTYDELREDHWEPEYKQLQTRLPRHLAKMLKLGARYLIRHIYRDKDRSGPGGAAMRSDQTSPDVDYLRLILYELPESAETIEIQDQDAHQIQIFVHDNDDRADKNLMPIRIVGKAGAGVVVRPTLR